MELIIRQVALQPKIPRIPLNQGRENADPGLKRIGRVLHVARAPGQRVAQFLVQLRQQEACFGIGKARDGLDGEAERGLRLGQSSCVTLLLSQRSKTACQSFTQARVVGMSANQHLVDGNRLRDGLEGLGHLAAQELSVTEGQQGFGPARHQVSVSGVNLGQRSRAFQALEEVRLGLLDRADVARDRTEARVGFHQLHPGRGILTTDLDELLVVVEGRGEEVFAQVLQARLGEESVLADPGQGVVDGSAGEPEVIRGAAFLVTGFAVIPLGPDPLGGDSQEADDDDQGQGRRRTFMVVEPLEGRQMLSGTTWTVTDFTDNGTNSLNWAITQSNASTSTSPHIINFQDTTNSVETITVPSALPTITHSVTIEGPSQSGAAWVQPLIELLGTGTGSSAVGLNITASSTQVTGLAIDGFQRGGVYVNGASDVTISNDWIGINPNGQPAANSNNGVVEYKTVSDTLQDDIISGNSGNGVVISASTGDVVQGSYIGCGETATTALANTGDGLLLENGANGNTIGGASDSNLDIISGNSGDGVVINHSSQNVVLNSYIGCSPNTSRPVPNADDGVLLEEGAAQNTIGGTSASGLNEIAGNLEYGVQLSTNADENVVEDDYIGLYITSDSSEVRMPNGEFGVSIDSGGNRTQSAGQRPSLPSSRAMGKAGSLLLPLAPPQLRF